MADLFTVQVEEMAGSPRFSASYDGQMRGQRDFKAAWTDVPALLVDLLGGSKPDEHAPDGSIYIPPSVWPDDRYPNLFCLNADSVPLGDEAQRPASPAIDPAGLMNYTFAKVTATYGIPKFDPGSLNGGTLREERIEFAADVQSLSTEAMTWDQGGARAIPADVTIGKVFGSMDYLVFFPNRATIPIAAIAAAVGTVNAATITAFVGYGSSFTFPVETLLFLPPSASRSVSANGLNTWGIQYRLSYKVTGWNSFFDPESSSGNPFVPIYRAVGAGRQLFKPHLPVNWLPLLT